MLLFHSLNLSLEAKLLIRQSSEKRMEMESGDKQPAFSLGKETMEKSLSAGQAHVNRDQWNYR